MSQVGYPFQYKPGRSIRIRCSICGREGYPGGRWMEACERGHAPCPDCGKQLSLLANGSPRTHARCPVREGRR